MVWLTGTLDLETHIGSELLEDTFADKCFFKKTKILGINGIGRLVVCHKTIDNL